MDLFAHFKVVLMAFGAMKATTGQDASFYIRFPLLMLWLLIYF